MNRKLRLRVWLPALSVAAISVVSGSWIMHAQQAPNPNFTGTVVPLEDKQGNIAHFRFEPGSRTKWHSHEGGQIILLEEGVGLTQVKGGPVIELHAGEAIYCPPGVVHWHGAAPDKGGVQYNVSRGGITWSDAVTEKEYTAKTVRLIIPH